MTKEWEKTCGECGKTFITTKCGVCSCFLCSLMNYNPRWECGSSKVWDWEILVAVYKATGIKIPRRYVEAYADNWSHNLESRIEREHGIGIRINMEITKEEEPMIGAY